MDAWNGLRSRPRREWSRANLARARRTVSITYLAAVVLGVLSLLIVFGPPHVVMGALIESMARSYVVALLAIYAGG